MATVWDEINQLECFRDPDKISTAVITGNHPFNVPGFHTMLRSIQEIETYPQQLNNFIVDVGGFRHKYDVILFYIFHLHTPQVQEPDWWWFGKSAQSLKDIGDTKQGIVILHHAIASFGQWEFWSDLVGIPHEMRTFKFEELRLSFCHKLYIKIVDPNHPITKGLSDWEIYGETWGPVKFFPGPECRILMTTDHPKMAMKAMAWTHQYKNARVFCLQPGHNNDIFSDPTFRKVLSRGIQWAAGRL
jgi:hypothetical protein